jgi:hypothetical protein
MINLASRLQTPHPDRIFHYTSIDTLALILKTQKIRFARLDGVDDAREAPTVEGISFSKYFFVSCWTGEPRESIPQWHLYTDKMTGVRIELPSYPFQQKRLTPPATWTDWQTQGILRSPIDFDQMYGSSHLVVPMCLSRDQFGGRVEYVDNVNERYEAAVSVQAEKISISRPFDLVRLKTKDWEFQDEYRFALLVLPSLPMPIDRPAHPDFFVPLAQHTGNAIRTGQAPGIAYLDVDLRASALSELVVTTGPLCSSGAKLCVESLVKQYARNGRVQASALEGGMRHR